MDDSCNLMLNICGETKPTKSNTKTSRDIQSSQNDLTSENKPLISFVAKPRLGEKVDGVKRPKFLVVRKKASLPQKKKLSEVKSISTVSKSFNKSSVEDATSNSVINRVQKQKLPEAKSFSTVSKTFRRPVVEDVARNSIINTAPKRFIPIDSRIPGSDANFTPLTQNKMLKKPFKTQSNKKADWNVSEHNNSSTYNTGVISSLFLKNPEIPTITPDKVETTEEKVFSSLSFSTLNIHKHLIATLEKDLDLKHMTEAQSRTIPVLLEKKDALVKSQTGSGKTLAYAIPIVEKLQRITPKIERNSGVFALVIVPTRELVLQTYSWFVKILKPFTWIVPGYLIGGEKKKSEKARIRKGINILISTPGRLLDHLSSTRNLNLGRLHWLVMDEADRLLDMGYEKDVAKIVSTAEEHFSKEGGFGRRQNVMVSATLSQGVEKLAGLTLNDPAHITMAEEGSVNQDQLVTPTNLKQWYLIVAPKLRLVTLSAFIMSKCTISEEKKVLIFMTTQDSVDYHTELFNRVLANREGRPKISFYKLHGNMPQKDRTAIFKEFRDTESGVLLCTDVAARGLDLSSLEWIVQYNPPVTVEDYVHRVGRTARVGKCGQAIIFLAPHETDFIHRLASRGISVVEKNPDTILNTLVKSWAKIATQSMEQTATALQLCFEEYVVESFNLYEMATKGYVSFVRSYAALPKDVRNIFDFKSLHLGHYAKSFALRDPPAQINSAGRASQWNDRPEKFATARERKIAKKNALAPPPAADGSESAAPPISLSYRERKTILSEFSSGLDPVPAKKMKMRPAAIDSQSEAAATG